LSAFYFRHFEHTLRYKQLVLTI